MLRPLGVDRPEVRFDFPDDPADGVRAGDPPRNGTGRPLCHDQSRGRVAFAALAAERFAAVAEHLGRQWSLPTIVVWYGDRERVMAERVVAGAGGYAHLPPATRLTELAAVTRLARLFVSSDTGPLHLASAVGTPCVALFGPSRADRCRPYGPQHIAIQQRSIDALARNRRTASSELMGAISVELVCGACDQILGRGGIGDWGLGIGD